MKSKAIAGIILIWMMVLACSFVRPTVSLETPPKGTRTPLATVNIIFPGTAAPETVIGPTATIAPSPTVPTPTVPTPTVEIPKSVSLVPQESYEEVESPFFHKTVRSITMEGDSFYAAPFNQAVQELIDHEFENFMKGVSEIEAWRVAVIPDMYSTFEVNARVIFNEHYLVSVLFDFDIYSAGAAHPLDYSKTITYYLQEARVLKLEDLFLSDSPWLESISELTSNDLDMRYVLEYPGGAGPDVNNFQNWTVDYAGLRFYFDPYQITSYAVGRQEVLIPFAALEKLLAKPGVLDTITP